MNVRGIRFLARERRRKGDRQLIGLQGDRATEASACQCSLPGVRPSFLVTPLNGHPTLFSLAFSKSLSPPPQSSSPSAFPPPPSSPLATSIAPLSHIQIRPYCLFHLRDPFLLCSPTVPGTPHGLLPYRPDIRVQFWSSYKNWRSPRSSQCSLSLSPLHSTCRAFISRTQIPEVSVLFHHR